MQRGLGKEWRGSEDSFEAMGGALHGGCILREYYKLWPRQVLWSQAKTERETEAV